MAKKTNHRLCELLSLAREGLWSAFFSHTQAALGWSLSWRVGARSIRNTQP